jgi:hypothetical protein
MRRAGLDRVAERDVRASGPPCVSPPGVTAARCRGDTYPGREAGSVRCKGGNEGDPPVGKRSHATPDLDARGTTTAGLDEEAPLVAQRQTQGARSKSGGGPGTHREECLNWRESVRIPRQSTPSSHPGRRRFESPGFIASVFRSLYAGSGRSLFVAGRHSERLGD